MDNKMTPEEQLEACRKFIQSWAYTGYNGSPYTEEQAQRLEKLIQNHAWNTYIKIFGKNP